MVWGLKYLENSPLFPFLLIEMIWSHVLNHNLALNILTAHIS